MGAVAMGMLALLALVVAGMVYSSTGAIGLPALFVLLAVIGVWQVAYYRRMEKQ